VNLDKLSKQLRRDVAAHPKKAALLALMALVAIYFWAPLLRKLVPTNQNAENAALVPANLPASTPAIAQTMPSRGAANFNWEKIQDLIRRDSHMVSASFDPTWTNPFGANQTALADESIESQTTPRLADDPDTKAAAMLATLRPQDLGIVLGGTMIGPRGRLATINDEPCREGDVILVGLKNDKSMVFDFQVLKITRQSVQLGKGGKTLTVELPAPKLGAGDDFPAARTK
jgi:hypothetical protein